MIVYIQRLPIVTHVANITQMGPAQYVDYANKKLNHSSTSVRLPYSNTTEYNESDDKIVHYLGMYINNKKYRNAKDSMNTHQNK